MNNYNFESTTSNNNPIISEHEKNILRNYYPWLASDIENIANFDIKELKKFCEICEKKGDFLWNSKDIEKRIIREFIIKPLSSKDKYFQLKVFWWFIMDKDLDNEVLELLKLNVPDTNEWFKLNWILKQWDDFWFSDKVDSILLINESDEEERVQINYQDELDLEEEIKLEKNKKDNTIIELDDLEILD